jgi:hypothetical protein
MKRPNKRSFIKVGYQQPSTIKYTPNLREGPGGALWGEVMKNEERTKATCFPIPTVWTG